MADENVIFSTMSEDKSPNVDGLSPVARHLISQLKLKKLETEGGYYKETHRSKEIVDTSLGKRNQMTGIYYMLDGKDFSSWHMLRDINEVWCYHLGSCFRIHMINPDGKYKSVLLGNPLTDSESRPQFVVPKNTWFAAELTDQTTCGLVSATCVHGFDFEDFVALPRQELLKKFPDQEVIITRLTRV